MLKIIIWPNPILHIPSAEVLEPADTLAEDMYEAMKAAGGVGLSAVQVGVHLRLVVLDVGQGMETYYNPVWTPNTSKPIKMLEGCLSAPGVFETVNRFDSITVTHGLPNNRIVEVIPGPIFDPLGNATLKAQCIQHECEHLDGKFFLDHVKKAKRSQYFSNMVALKKVKPFKDNYR